MRALRAKPVRESRPSSSSRFSRDSSALQRKRQRQRAELRPSATHSQTRERSQSLLHAHTFRIASPSASVYRCSRDVMAAIQSAATFNRQRNRQQAAYATQYVKRSMSTGQQTTSPLSIVECIGMPRGFVIVHLDRMDPERIVQNATCPGTVSTRHQS